MVEPMAWDNPRRRFYAVSRGAGKGDACSAYWNTSLTAPASTGKHLSTLSAAVFRLLISHRDWKQNPTIVARPAIVLLCLSEYSEINQVSTCFITVGFSDAELICAFHSSQGFVPACSVAFSICSTNFSGRVACSNTCKVGSSKDTTKVRNVKGKGSKCGMPGSRLRMTQAPNQII
jgi:hypothetical protein